ncbi:hypothetical protein PLESTB_001339000 [Pleodorina starrii]|uniref:DNA excision repair protein ERCC-8 n=1 Tax=Pleodorina starrii TaxID=330485 RepID=A0A9W6F747_9CHLO|nr:hypothetical protein PLESTB_001339000 [Pleodorina starrii]
MYFRTGEHVRAGRRQPPRYRNWQKQSNECLGLSKREDGFTPIGLQSWMHTRRMAQLRPDNYRRFKCPFGGGVTCMDLDKTEDRFLLAGAADTTIALFDTHTVSEKAETLIAPIFSYTRHTNAAAHKFMISSVAWYPVDTGLFVTGSYDCNVKVWDTNEIEVVGTFQLPKKVTGVAMSLVAAAHTLIAASCEDTHVRLCDPTSGAITHVFSGHRDAVWCVAWSTCSEYEVLSGDGGGQIRLWDIRRAGCRAVFDQYCTQRPSRSASAEDPTMSMSPSKKQRRGGAAGAMHSSSSAPALLAPEPAASARMKEAAVRAHSGAVTCVLPCPDALSLLSAGTDGRMRLWDAHSRVNKLVGYEGTHNRALRTRQLAVTGDARVVFYPTGSSMNIYEVGTGRMLASLQGGHTESINCCTYNPSTHELYSGANDRVLRVWTVQPDADRMEDEDCEGGAKG